MGDVVPLIRTINIRVVYAERVSILARARARQVSHWLAAARAASAIIFM